MVDAKTGALGHVGVALSFGLVIMVMIYAAGHIQGAHFNPAVTFAFALTRHFPWPRAAGYWLSSFSARSRLLCSCACSARKTSRTSARRSHRGHKPSRSSGSSSSAPFLMFVILAVATDTRAVGEAAAIAIGGTVGPRCHVRRAHLRRCPRIPRPPPVGPPLSSPATCMPSGCTSSLHRGRVDWSDRVPVYTRREGTTSSATVGR